MKLSVEKFQILQLQNVMNFLFSRYELSDGQIRSEAGAYKDGEDADGNPAKVLVVQGAYSFVAPGQIFMMLFTTFRS